MAHKVIVLRTDDSLEPPQPFLGVQYGIDAGDDCTRISLWGCRIAHEN